MDNTEILKASDAVVVARFLQIRAVFHDRHLAHVERLIQERYLVQPTRRLHSTLVAHIRTGFVRPGEGDLWPVVFLTAVDISLALCVELSEERVANLGTMVNGPHRLRHRNWEDWWGWEKPLGALQADFFDLPVNLQEEAIVAWYQECLEWLASSGLLLHRL
jgi:hypothetical protein